MTYIALLLALLLPQRIVTANVITSTGDPAVQITLPKAATYVGTDRWVLFGIANCELFAFVEADGNKHVKRLYWVQFEGYIPSMPNLHHTYDSKEHATMGGLSFFVDTWTESSTPSKPDTTALAAIIRAKGYAVPAAFNSGSDQQHIYTLIASKGYVLPPTLSSVRFVHTLDEARKELMIIYSEPFASGRTPADKEKHALVQRAESALIIEPRS